MTDKCSFGYQHLRKKGWIDGNGLGRTNSGDANPIKVNLKHDTAGLGHDMSKDFTNQWWDHVFNKAAAKVSVSTDGNEVKVKSADLTDENKVKLKQKALYGKFVKGTRLEHGVETHEERDSDSSEDNSMPAISILTDEELLNACGGRTAHKGARHGFTMNGKLARVEQQDSNPIDRLSSTDSPDRESWPCKTEKKKQKKSRMPSKKAEKEAEELRPVKKRKHGKTSSKHFLCSDGEEGSANNLDDGSEATSKTESKKQKKKKRKDKHSRKEDES
ncbi:G patch domain-containing protein 4-like [Watersipora subatra]|uniref:G patch domain-containing protein 4-like n=1 Tax=Watersipora subatra TaxID=2589382 RepID=UPI00355BB601